jgi:hypothetical protein
MEPTPRDEMDALLDALLRFAQQSLERHSEFYPFAAVVDSDGQIQLVAGYAGDDNPDSLELIDLLYESLTRQSTAGEIRAAAVCADVRVTPPGAADKTDAIRVAIEHANADPVEVLLPYGKRRLRGIDYGELFAQSGTARVFAQ